MFNVVFFSLFLLSCVTQRNLEYLRSKADLPADYNENTFQDYILEPYDALYIQITSENDASPDAINRASANQAGMSSYGAYMNAYIVDKDGFIEIPIVGKLEVAKKTMNEVSLLIKNKVINILNQPIVTVRLVNQYVTIIGEVKAPGHYTYTQDKLSIFNAIGLAGDITSYGNRKEVILIRNQNGVITQNSLNLSKPDILSSEYYYIQPNDMIYVKSLKKRMWGMENFPFDLIFSGITTVILLYTFIGQL